ncbi:MAG: hypothetical protein QME96_05415, partial [Myxococcota bacterium]|nr:hypothetical protein [Myxococcota bacterium]
MRANAIHDGGFHLTGTSVWLDPRRHAEFGIVSDALGEARPARAVTTPTTALLLRRRGGGASVVAAPVHRPFSVGDVDVELVPSGAMPGGAQVLLR